MAQHIPIENFKPKRFAEIKRVIINDFKRSNGLLKTSLKYEFLGVQGNKDVYLINKTIPKGIVWGSTVGAFEIHYSDFMNKVTDIYLVA